MRSIKFSLSKKPPTEWNGWDTAVYLVEGYLSAKLKADQVLENLPREFVGQERSRCQSLFLGALRHGHRTRRACQPLLRKQPQARVEAVLLVAGFEINDESVERHPKVVHHAVERSKGMLRASEQGFLNAVLRKLPSQIEALRASDDLAARHSHPDWLVQNWVDTFGTQDTEELLEWNQQIPHFYFKTNAMEGHLPSCLSPTEWPGFYCVDTKRDWKADLLPLINRGIAYFKDPSTRMAPGLLAPQAGEQVLDLCAAPGGKAFDLAHTMEHKGTLVAVDLPCARIARLRTNLSTLETNTFRCNILESDLLKLDKNRFEQATLPSRYDAVMLDAPCSNTGVIQRRTDVKWRLQMGDIEDCARLQHSLLAKAAEFVKEDGRIVYSTCSIETAENRDVINAFLASEQGRTFALSEESISLPWKTGHDGAGAFLLRKK